MSPRTPAFDEAHVIDAAIESFIRHGYEGADTVTLCRDAGISRSSLYNSFGSKDELFLRALAEYSRRGREEAAALPLAEGRALERLRGRLLGGVMEQCADEHRDGCLSVNTAVELGRSMPQAAEVLDADRDAWIEAYARVLAQAEADGDLTPGQDHRLLGATLHTLLAGLRVAARVISQEALAAQVDALLASWATRQGKDTLATLVTRTSLATPPAPAGIATRAPGVQA